MPLPDNPHVSFVSASVAWTVPADLVSALPAAILDAVDRLPVLRSGTGSSGPYLRPPGHRRAFYVSLAGAGCLAVKGSEVCDDGFADGVRSLDDTRVWVGAQTGPVAHDILDMSAELRGPEKFALLEGKVPGALTLGEALSEANAALALQRAHLLRYGQPARAPFPLRVFRVPDGTSERALAALSPVLAPRVRELVAQLVAPGLAAYVYHYPTIPLRVAHLRAPELVLGLSRGALRRRLDALRASLDVPLAVSRWVELLARMLALGFLPTDPRAVLSGNCLQMQNATVDGGFVDLGSLYPLAEARDEREVRDALRRAVAELAETILRLHVGTYAPTAALRLRLPDVYAAVHEAVAAHLRAEADVPAAVRAVFVEPRTVADAVARILSSFDDP